MKHYFFLVYLCFVQSFVFAQNIYLTHRDYSSTPDVFTLIQLNESSGAVVNTNTYSTVAGVYSPESLDFSASSREIIGKTSTQVIFYHIDNHTERSFTLPSIAQTDYGDLVLANNRLFITKRDYSGSPYKYYLVELNQTTGAVIGTPYLFTTALVNYSPSSLTYLSSSNEIIGISDMTVVKYNITTQAESSFTLSAGASMDYGDVVVANSRLFVTKRDYSGSPTVHYMIELNPSTGAVIGTPYQFTTTLGPYSPASLTYLSGSNVIAGYSNNMIVKYNISTAAESSFALATQASSDYGDLVSIDQGSGGGGGGSTPVTSIKASDDTNISRVMIKAWNILGQSLPLNTVNQLMMVEYNDGSREKIFIKE
jgi:hypothetical protein